MFRKSSIHSQQSQLMEDPFNSEDAVDFKMDITILESQDLVERLSRAKISFNSDMSSSQEEGSCDGPVRSRGRFKEVRIKNLDQKNKSESNDGTCRNHPGVELEYWCEDDEVLACKECLIFGPHKGHTALSGEKKRFAKLLSLLPALQRELLWTEESGQRFEREGRKHLDKMIAEVKEFLESIFVQEKRKAASRLSDHCSKIQKTIVCLQSLQAGLSVVQLDQNEVAKLAFENVDVQLVPGTVVRQDSSLLITHPMYTIMVRESMESSNIAQIIPTPTKYQIIDTPEITTPQLMNASSFRVEADSHNMSRERLKFSNSIHPSPSLTTSQSLNTASCAGQPQSPSMVGRIEQLDLQTLRGQTVTVEENGTPGQFYCRMSSDTRELECEEMEKLLEEVIYEVIFNPIPGQGVLISWEGKWSRATVLEGMRSSCWRCELVDLGQVVEVSLLDMTNLPHNVMAIPARTVCCSLIGVKERDWSEQVRRDWERLVSGKQFRVVEQTDNCVNLVLGVLSLVDRLQFLGHLLEDQTASPGQYFSSSENLATTANLCNDYEQLSPHTILIYIDIPLQHHQMQLIDQIDLHPDLVLPGLLQPGHAVLAPWQGSLYRAIVMSISDTLLTVMYVDHGNTDTASWWDCKAMPSHLLFPPLATLVSLTGLRQPVEGGWTLECRERLREVLSRGEIEVVYIQTEGIMILVEFKVKIGNNSMDVGKLLIEEGYARSTEDFPEVLSPRSGRSGDESGECMMSFLHVEEAIKSDQIMQDTLRAEGDCVSWHAKLPKVDHSTATRGLVDLDNDHLDENFDLINDIFNKFGNNRSGPSNECLIPEFDDAAEAVEVDVLHVESPDKIWFRLSSDKDRWTEFHQDLQEAGERYLVEDIELDNWQKVLCKVDGAWHRGRVLEIGDMCQVNLVDWGMNVMTDRENLRKIEEQRLEKEQMFAQCVGLSGIEPAGSGGWSASSVDFLTRVTKKRKIVLKNKSAEQDLLVEERTMINPLDVETVVRTTISDMLMDQGLALKKNTRNKCTRSWIESGMEDSSGNDTTEEDGNYELEERVISISPSTQNLSPSMFPSLPRDQVFPVILTHIDCYGVVWVVPMADRHLWEEIVVELSNCSESIQYMSPGLLVVARRNGVMVRGRVLEEEGVVSLVDIDSGEMFLSVKKELRKCSSSLLLRPPLAVPLKLYGITRILPYLCEPGRAAVVERMKEKSNCSPKLQCVVSLLESVSQEFPLPANVRYTMVEELDGNLALDMVDVGLFDVITTTSQWEKEMAGHGLDWMLDLMSVPPPLSFLPHPLPLAVGQWYHISVEGLEYPLVEGEELEPGVDTPDANRIGVHIRPLDCKSVFDLHQQEICRSLRTLTPQIVKLNKAMKENRDRFAISASTAEPVPIPTVGQSVLAYYPFEEGGEWCRGTVETILSGEQVTVYYTDYGHRGLVGLGHLRSMKYQERMMPVKLREVVFSMPNSDRELAAVRLDFRQGVMSLQEERLMMRVDKISSLGHPVEVEQIVVSVWRAVDGEGNLRFQLHNIC